jgi:hypothetical protein
VAHESLSDRVAGMEDVDRHVPRLGVGDAGPEELPELVHAGLDVDGEVVFLHRVTLALDLTRASGPERRHGRVQQGGKGLP